MTRGPLDPSLMPGLSRMLGSRLGRLGPPAAPPVPPAAVAAVAFGAFVVGAALAGGLWLVHVRTAPRIPPVPPGPGAAPRPRGSQPRTPDPKQPAGGTATPPAKA
ncbi:transforming growth factor-beta receptor type 3-like protein [Rhea pennata]|uniref:transforming growth factor-beta receptor type 3-like protein n=1 Tax=Rhea pennata TaxID=8795 RepID=UPI002E25458C